MTRGTIPACSMAVLWALAACSGGGSGANEVALSVQKRGAGSGTVSGAGIACGGSCAVSLAQGATVTLTATPVAGSTFAGWSGCDSTSEASCTCAMRTGKTVTASFELAATETHTLTVQKSGSGSGAVRGAGIGCGVACSVSVADGAVVTLTAAPDASSIFAVTSPRGAIVTLTATAGAGSSFESWSGCDSTSGATCTCTMSASRTVTASFAGCSVDRLSVQDNVAVVNDTAVLTAVVTAGTCSPSLEVDWTADACQGAWVSPRRGVSTTFHAPAAPAKCRVVAPSVADPTRSDFAYVIVDTFLRTRMTVLVGPNPWGLADALWSLAPEGHVLAVASTGAGTVTTLDVYGTDGATARTWNVGANPRGDMGSGPNRDVWVTLTGEDKVARISAGGPSRSSTPVRCRMG